ncbi:MAG: exodeoxyribonuclease VII small subunit [Chloroflexi bacterium]|nr:exodeoxyribonuclease VII small subunit [Chloroflexota bacterium]
MEKDSQFSPYKIDELTYEQAVSELESIVLALESESHSLDESLALYERGQLLAKRCAVLLNQAELKVKLLSEENLVNFPEEE